MPASAIAEMLEQTSFTEIKHNLKAAEKATQELEQAQAQAERELKQNQMEQQAKLEEQRVENENLNKEEDRKNRIEIALIQAGASEIAGNVGLDKSAKDYQIKQEQNSIKTSEADETARANRADEEIKREDNRI